jgi:hypothetical protein
VIGPLCSGAHQLGVRWNTVRCAAVLATSWIVWTPVAPVPITATRLPSKLHGFMRPVGGMAGLAEKAVDSFDAWQCRSGQRADRRYQEAAGHGFARIQRQLPRTRRLVPVGCGHLALKQDVASQIELVAT